MRQDPLPNDKERCALAYLIQNAFVDLRYLEGEQAHDLAYSFHNLPVEIYGWGTWSITGMRGRLAYHQSKHQTNLGFDYVSAFNEIFPLSA